MQIFMTNPEALEYGPGQAWLSPPEALYNALQTKMAPRDEYRSFLTERAATLRRLLRKVEDELHYLGRS